MITINGRDYKLIDAHFHIWNRMHGFRFKDVPSEPIGSGRVRVGTREYQFMAPSFTETTSPLEALEVEMDNCGVDKGVLLQTPCYGEQIDYVARAMKKWPGRFATTALANPCYGKDRFIQEADRAIQQENCRGIKFEMPDTPFEADAAEYQYIFEYIQEHGLFCMVDMGWGQGKFDYPIQAYEKTVKKYRDLTFVFPHLGVSRLWDPAEDPNFETLKRTLALMELNDNVWFDCAGIPMLTGEYEEYPYSIGNAALKVVHKQIGVHHLMFGTDYPGSTPYCTYKQSIDHIVRHCHFFRENEWTLFLSKNAEKLWFS